MSARDEEELMQRLDRESAAQTERVRQLLFSEGRPDLVADLDRNLKDVRTGVSHARNIWHSISWAQRKTLLWLHARTTLERIPASKLYGSAAMKVCRVATLRNLESRGLIAWDGGAFDPEGRVLLTEHGRFVVLRALRDEEPTP